MNDRRFSSSSAEIAGSHGPTDGSVYLPNGEHNMPDKAGALKPTEYLGNRVTLEGMTERIVDEHYITYRTLTICVLTMVNGYYVVGEAAPAMAENFDPEKGRKFAREAAIRKLWQLESYALRESLYRMETFVGAVKREGDEFTTDFATLDLDEPVESNFGFYVDGFTLAGTGKVGEVKITSPDGKTVVVASDDFLLFLDMLM